MEETVKPDVVEAEAAAGEEGGRAPGGRARWTRGKALSWERVRPERVCEVAVAPLRGYRFGHAATSRRWRPDRAPAPPGPRRRAP